MIKFYPIPNFPCYLINKDGQIFSLKTSKLLNLYIGKNGYKECCVYNDNTRRRVTVSQLLRETFFERPKYIKVDARLKDGDRSNAKVSNIFVQQRQSIYIGKDIKLSLKNLKNEKVFFVPSVNIASYRQNNNMTILNTIRNSKGRFFGLQTKNETLNAQFRGETPSFVKVWDRNANRLRKFNKNSLVKANIA